MIPIISQNDKDFNKKFIDALTNVGFVQIEDHDCRIPHKELLKFFDFSEDIKKSQKLGKWFPNRIDAPKEGIEWKIDFSPSDYPLESHDWITKMKESQSKINIFAKNLLNIINENIHMFPIKDFSSTFRLLKYHEAIGDIKCNEHTDSGLLTILWQGAPGLEVEIDGRWEAVPVLDGGLVINIGDALEQLSGYQLKATNHRVRNNYSNEPRYSIPFFVEPVDDLILLDPSGEMLPYSIWLENKFKRANFVEYHK